MGHARDWFNKGTKVQKEPKEALALSPSYGQFMLSTHHSATQQIPADELLLKKPANPSIPGKCTMRRIQRTNNIEEGCHGLQAIVQAGKKCEDGGYGMTVMVKEVIQMRKGPI
jgi:hypothetical protein